MKHCLELEPVEKRLIWGGESWVVAAHENGDCVIKNGMFAGQTLSALWDEKRYLFGNMDCSRFPLLVKVIYAVSDLSIQVHPDDAYAARHEGGASGKTECWYVLDAKKGASLVMGTNAADRQEAERLIAMGDWDGFLNTRKANVGDFFFIEAGTVHAIKGGLTLLEIQQNSDITYRVYDYDRLENGKLRKLHLEKALDVISYGTQTPFEKHIDDMDGCRRTILADCPKFRVDKWELEGCGTTLGRSAPFLCLDIIEGKGMLDNLPVAAGTHLLLLPCGETFTLAGDLAAIVTRPGVG